MGRNWNTRVRLLSSQHRSGQGGAARRGRWRLFATVSAGSDRPVSSTPGEDTCAEQAAPKVLPCGTVCASSFAPVKLLLGCTVAPAGRGLEEGPSQRLSTAAACQTARSAGISRKYREKTGAVWAAGPGT